MPILIESVETYFKNFRLYLKVVQTIRKIIRVMALFKFGLKYFRKQFLLIENTINCVRVYEIRLIKKTFSSQSLCKYYYDFMSFYWDDHDMVDKRKTFTPKCSKSI